MNCRLNSQITKWPTVVNFSKNSRNHDNLYNSNYPISDKHKFLWPIELTISQANPDNDLKPLHTATQKLKLSGSHIQCTWVENSSIFFKTKHKLILLIQYLSCPWNVKKEMKVYDFFHEPTLTCIIKERDMVVRNLLTVPHIVHNQHQKGKCHHLSSWKTRWTTSNLLEISLFPDFFQRCKFSLNSKWNFQTFPMPWSNPFFPGFSWPLTAMPNITVLEMKHCFFFK